MTKYIEHVIVRDYGKQGLAVFDMRTSAQPGNICCWSTLIDYGNQPRGFRPGVDVAYSYDEVPMDYFRKGKLMKPGSAQWKALKCDELLKRYKAWCLPAYEHGTDLHIIPVQRDQHAYKKERWTR